MPLQACQDATTSTEFLEWMVFLEQEEWERDTKTHHYLAQIAMEIRLVMQGLAGLKKELSIKDFLLKAGEVRPKGEPKKYAVGEDLVKDPKWAAVNAAAKSVWAARLGMLKRGEDGDNNPAGA